MKNLPCKGLRLCPTILFVFLYFTYLPAQPAFDLGDTAQVAFKLQSKAISTVFPCPLLEGENILSAKLEPQNDGSYALYRESESGDKGGFGCAQNAESNVWTKVTGIGGDYLVIKWQTASRVKYTCADPVCFDVDAWARGESDFDLHLVIKGIPSSTQVPIHYLWTQLSSCGSKSENNEEDSARVSHRIRLVNTMLDDRTSMATMSKFIQVGALDQTGIITASGGDVIKLKVLSEAFAYVDDAPDPDFGLPAYYHRDLAFAESYGYLILSIGNPIVIPTLNSPQQIQAFSLDIGSDAEFSEQVTPANAWFDPGDMYEFNSPAPPPAQNGIFHDAACFYNVDPAPNVNDASTRAPLCFNLNQDSLAPLYFDLDGFDALDINLLSYAFGPGVPPIQQYPSDCIFHPEFMLLSFDEDQGVHYTGSGGYCDIPVASVVPPRGSTTDRDEVIYGNVTRNHILNSYSYSAFGYGSEDDVHQGLAPSPNVGIHENDDVDALDSYAPDSCGYFYFTADHEASYQSFAGAPTLNPGVVYIWMPPNIHQPVVFPDIHLGLAQGVDLNDFEFAWLWNPSVKKYTLALVFSVDQDDPNTPAFESDTLNPGQLYASFLDGTHFPFGPNHIGENIDGLAFSNRPLLPQGSQVTVVGLRDLLRPAVGALKIAPTIATDRVTISWETAFESKATLTVTDAAGRTVSRHSLIASVGQPSFDLDVQNLASGLYFVQMTFSGENGAYAVMSGKFIVPE
ncbi:MAG: T9SS C-terminal target domain-containing protein [Haliscomenobacteraceae bacterium CHB4]|nr:T9SS C-terminal target domain-containing protein [Haliscomenobacteraceae bacterium CHB4]